MLLEAGDPRLPVDVELEMRLLSNVLTYPATYYPIQAWVAPSDFTVPVHREIWEVCQQYFADAYEGIAANPGSDVWGILPILLEQYNKLEIRSYIYQRLAGLCVAPHLTADYARKIRESAVKRQTAKQALKLVGAAAEQDPQTYIATFREKLDQLADRLPSISFDSLQELSKKVLESILNHEPDQLLGLSTGINDLDDYLNGLRPGQIVVIGGRPQHGKTQLALNLMHLPITRCRNFAPDYSAVFVSLEMPKQEIVERLLCQISQVPGELIQKGLLTAKDAELLEAGQQKLKEMPFVIWDETDNCSTVMRLEAKLRQLPKLPSIVLIDYLQYMQNEKPLDNPVQEYDKIIKDLKRLAVRLGIPIVVLSQLSRKVEERQNKRPMPADLRDSGGIEQAADTIIFVYREAVYCPSVTPGNIAELVIAKHRRGRIGAVYPVIDLSTGLFFDNERGKAWKPVYSSEDEPERYEAQKRRKGATFAANTAQD